MKRITEMNWGDLIAGAIGVIIVIGCVLGLISLAVHLYVDSVLYLDKLLIK